MWMLRTCSAAVIGLSTLTVSGTEFPFSAMGGMSSATLPWWSRASPRIALMAAAAVSGLASAARRRAGAGPGHPLPPG